MSVVWGARECADAFLLISVLFSYVCCLGGKGMRRCIPFDFCSVFLCLLFWGEGNAQMHSVDFCSVFLCLLFWGEGNAQMHFVDLWLLFGGRGCAYAFRLISALSFYVCCFGGKGMRRCIPFDFCSVFLCLLFWGEGNAQMHSVCFI